MSSPQKRPVMPAKASRHPPCNPPVIPAQAGIHGCPTWIPASAGMTGSRGIDGRSPERRALAEIHSPMLAMNLDTLVATILALAVLVYLIYSLLRPERF